MQKEKDMSLEGLFSLPEQLKELDTLTATYYCEFQNDIDVIAKASSFAVGQTVGTWIPVPGVTEEMRQKHMGRVAGIFDVPPSELVTQIGEGKRGYLIQIAFPTANFGSEFPMMLTTLMGNDASTSTQAKLVDLQMTGNHVAGFNGPNFGIEGIREMTGVTGRPLLLSMIKPCTGVTPKAGAEILYGAAIGGVDIVKDDELMGNMPFSTIQERVKEYNRAAVRAFEETGQKSVYVVNITGENLIENANKAVDAGAKAVMAAFSAVGYGALHSLARAIKVPILGHYASSGMLYEGMQSGMASYLAVGRFPRLAGADMVVINTPFGGYPLQYEKYIRTVHHLTLPFFDKKPVMPIVGGGVHPGMSEQYVSDLGRDIVLGSGGAIYGHPMGAAAGAKAMRQSIDAVMEGTPLDEYGKNHPELKKALELWGYKKAGR
jgi:2,3-diketo-5-methylthiopentyl-1-phosphate enolase